MNDDLDHLREQAERARRWATWMIDPSDRERFEVFARDYEQMAFAAEHACQTDPR